MTFDIKQNLFTNIHSKFYPADVEQYRHNDDGRDKSERVFLAEGNDEIDDDQIDPRLK